MAEETAYAARMKKEAAAEECFTVMLDGVRAFFDGRATLHISPMLPGTGQAIRFVKDTTPLPCQITSRMNLHTEMAVVRKSEFIGTPKCQLKRVSKSKRPAVYFCSQCHHTTGKNECPFAPAFLEEK